MYVYQNPFEEVKYVFVESARIKESILSSSTLFNAIEAAIVSLKRVVDFLGFTGFLGVVLEQP
jgi:hypothetical protein